MEKKDKKLELKVADAYRDDIGRGIVRIDPYIAREHGINTGDFILIKGKKETAALVYPAYASDKGLDIIRMDGYIRRNAGVSLGDRVIIEKVEPQAAKKIILAPLKEYNIEIGDEYIEYFKRRMIRNLYTKDDIVSFGVFGGSLYYKVVDVVPRGVVYVTKDTILEVKSSPLEIESIPTVTYDDIGGLKDAISKIREMVELPLKYPELYQKLGIEPPKGVLLYGPPGTGKTLLAKAVANESGARFFSINGPEIVSKYVGESEKQLREMFEKAQKNAPSIIFIDEIDSIAPKREESVGEVERRMVSQLLTLMDGLKERGKVIVIAATNRPDALDPALRRPGRFDREIEIGIPNKEAREEILKIHTRNMPLAEDVDLNEIAALTHGYSGADLAALCREAAINRLRKVIPEVDLEKESLPKEILDKLVVTKQDFYDALKIVSPSAMREVLIEVPNIKWEDIGGLKEVKQQLIEAVELPLKQPEKFRKFGIRRVKGILLTGPPGTGKTLLAKAVANESGANFIYVKAPEFLSKWVGESEKRVREIFKKAKQVAPTIIFIDEIDAIAKVRGTEIGSGVTDKVVNSLLLELDGLEELNDVIVLAATNRADIIDPALKRPGRFDFIIEVPLPDLEAREEIFKVHTKKMPLSSEVDIKELAQKTEGFSGAEIEWVCREAAMEALRNNKEQIDKDDFYKAIDKIKQSKHRTKDKGSYI